MLEELGGCNPPPLFRDCPHYLRDILLTDHVLSMFDLLWIMCYEDTSPLAAAVWLADERSVFSRTSVGLEISIAVQGRGDCYKLQKNQPLNSLVTVRYSNYGAAGQYRPNFCSRGMVHLFLIYTLQNRSLRDLTELSWFHLLLAHISTSARRFVGSGHHCAYRSQ